MPYWTIIVWLLVGAAVGYFGRKHLAQYIGSASPGMPVDVITGAVGGFLGGYILAVLGAGGFIGSILTIIAAALFAAVLMKFNYKLKQ